MPCKSAHNTRLTLAIRPSDQGMDCAAICIEHRRSDLSTAAKGRLSASCCIVKRVEQDQAGTARVENSEGCRPTLLEMSQAPE